MQLLAFLFVCFCVSFILSLALVIYSLICLLPFLKLHVSIMADSNWLFLTAHLSTVLPFGDKLIKLLPDPFRFKPIGRVASEIISERMSTKNYHVSLEPSHGEHYAHYTCMY